jgi:hypothetical protein
MIGEDKTRNQRVALIQQAHLLTTGGIQDCSTNLRGLHWEPRGILIPAVEESTYGLCKNAISAFGGVLIKNS